MGKASGTSKGAEMKGYSWFHVSHKWFPRERVEKVRKVSCGPGPIITFEMIAYPPWNRSLKALQNWKFTCFPTKSWFFSMMASIIKNLTLFLMPDCRHFFNSYHPSSLLSKLIRNPRYFFDISGKVQTIQEPSSPWPLPESHRDSKQISSPCSLNSLQTLLEG